MAKPKKGKGKANLGRSDVSGIEKKLNKLGTMLQGQVDGLIPRIEEICEQTGDAMMKLYIGGRSVELAYTRNQDMVEIRGVDGLAKSQYSLTGFRAREAQVLGTELKSRYGLR